MWVSRKCLKYPILWGPGPRGYGDTAMSFSQFGVNKTYRETLAFPKGATSRKREQPKPKQSKITMGFWDTFLLSVKWESVTKDIWHPPSWKRCLLLVVHFFFLEVFLLGRIPFQKLSQAFKIPHKVLFVKNCLAPTKLITSLCHHKEFQHFSFHHVKPWSTGIWTGQVEWRNVYAPTQYKSAGWWRQDTLILGTVDLLVAK